MYIPNTRWTRAFMITAILQAVVGIGLEAYVFAKFNGSFNGGALPPDHHSEVRTIPTYLAVFMFGFLYQVVLVYDALSQKNTIQVIGLVLYNIGILIYASIQFFQIDDAVKIIKGLNALTDLDVWPEIRAELITLPILMAVATLAFAFQAWKLYDEFAWTIYKHISADLRLKRRYLTYQIYIALLKFDFFFFLAFTIQFLVVVDDNPVHETVITSAALAITFVLLLMAAFWVRRESVIGMVVIIIFYFCALTYFIWKLVRMYAAEEHRVKQYLPARKSLASFAILTILLVIISIIIACMCTHNFNKGLKPHVSGKKSKTPGDKAGYGNEMPSLSGPAPAQRMEID